MSITALGYLGVSSPRSEAWRVFGTEFLGGQLAEDGPDDAVRLRIDDADWRIQIHPGDADKVEYFGWLVNLEEDLNVLIERLAAVGVTASRGSVELADARKVNQLITFTDPWGFAHEVAWGQYTAPSSFRPGRAISGFVTGQQGLGHVLLLIPDLDAAHEFFSGVLGFELSDKIIDPGKINARFYHVNARHHTLAIGQCPPGMAGFHHLMLQVQKVDDMGSAYDLLDTYDVPEVVSIGRHTNDQMISFYCTTPSTFNIEYGYDGLEITADWVPRVYTRIAIWGHKPHPEAKNRLPALIHGLPAS